MAVWCPSNSRSRQLLGGTRLVGYSRAITHRAVKGNGNRRLISQLPSCRNILGYHGHRENTIHRCRPRRPTLLIPPRKCTLFCHQKQRGSPRYIRHFITRTESYGLILVRPRQWPVHLRGRMTRRRIRIFPTMRRRNGPRTKGLSFLLRPAVRTDYHKGSTCSWHTTALTSTNC